MPEAVNVYVRDMAVQPAATEAEEAARPAGERAFTVVSAVDGSEEPLTYTRLQHDPGLHGDRALGDQRRRRRGGVRDDRRVQSRALPARKKKKNKKGKPPSRTRRRCRSRCATCAQHETVLVSRCYVRCEEAAEPAVGRWKAARPMARSIPVSRRSSNRLPRMANTAEQLRPGASLSADGSTVAWMGEDIGQQAALLPEETRPPALHRAAVAADRARLGNVTERVTGGSDPADPACVASGEGSLPAKPVAVRSLPGAVRR